MCSIYPTLVRALQEASTPGLLRQSIRGSPRLPVQNKGGHGEVFFHHALDSHGSPRLDGSARPGPHDKIWRGHHPGVGAVRWPGNCRLWGWPAPPCQRPHRSTFPLDGLPVLTSRPQTRPAPCTADGPPTLFHRSPTGPAGPQYHSAFVTTTAKSTNPPTRASCLTMKGLDLFLPPPWDGSRGCNLPKTKNGHPAVGEDLVSAYACPAGTSGIVCPRRPKQA